MHVNLNSFYVQRAIDQLSAVQAGATRDSERVFNARRTIFAVATTVVLVFRIFGFDLYAVRGIGHVDGHFTKTLLTIGAFDGIDLDRILVPDIDMNVAVDVCNADAARRGQRISLMKLVRQLVPLRFLSGIGKGW